MRRKHLLLTACLPCAQYRRNRDWRGQTDAASHTEQEESHAALQLQEITSVLMTQVSGECSASSVDLKPTVHSVTV